MPESEFSLDELVSAYGEPFPCQSAQAMLWVSQAVKPKATVLLTGDGGDDIFLGYPFFKNAQFAQQLARRIPLSITGMWRAAGKCVPGVGPLRRFTRLLNYATGGIGEHARANMGVPYLERRGIVGERLAGLGISQRQIPASFDSAKQLLADVVDYHHQMHFTSEFMPKVDGGTMHFGIEARAPFLDQHLWEFAASLPHSIHLNGGNLKAVLREIARRRIGSETAFRKKQGFTVPVERWLSDRWSGLLDELRAGTILERDGWVRRDPLRKTIDSSLRRRRVPIQLWRLLVLEHWLANAAGKAAVPLPSPSLDSAHVYA